MVLSRIFRDKTREEGREEGRKEGRKEGLEEGRNLAIEADRIRREGESLADAMERLRQLRRS